MNNTCKILENIDEIEETMMEIMEIVVKMRIDNEMMLLSLERSRAQWAMGDNYTTFAGRIALSVMVSIWGIFLMYIIDHHVRPIYNKTIVIMRYLLLMLFNGITYRVFHHLYLRNKYRVTTGEQLLCITGLQRLYQKKKIPSNTIIVKKIYPSRHKYICRPALSHRKLNYLT